MTQDSSVGTLDTLRNSIAGVPVSRIEAEAFRLDGYEIEKQSMASEGKVVKAVISKGSYATASTVFEGRAGFYDLTVGYLDENDGAGQMSLLVDGIEVRTWVLNKNSNRIEEIVLENLQLTPGQEITIIGQRHEGERGRFDFLELNPVQLETAPEKAELISAAPTHIQRFEAEDLKLDGYIVENKSSASGGTVVKAVVDKGATASAATIFDGQSGTYNITVGYLDESDGEGKMSLLIDGKVARTWVLDENSDAIEQIVLQGVALEAGQEIKIVGQRHWGERGRVDFVEFESVELSEAADKPANQHTASKLPEVTKDEAATDNQEILEKSYIAQSQGEIVELGEALNSFAQRFEVEDMSLTNYSVRSESGASEGELVRLSDIRGEASAAFYGPSGKYDIKVRYLDESDGRSTISVLVDGKSVGSWLLDDDNDQFAHQTLEGVQIETGQDVTIVGTKESGERARLDFVEITRTQSDENSGSPDTDDGDGTPPTNETDPPQGENDKDLGEFGAKMFAPYAEWTLSSDTNGGNPYDLDGNVIFTHTASGDTIKTGMFYTGDGAYSFRFAGVKEGEWTFRTQSPDSDLDGFAGSVTVAENDDARGFVVASNGKFAQQLGDGSLDAILPNFAMIDPDLSSYRDDPNKIHKLIDTFIVEHGFTGLHIPNIGGQFFDIDNTTGEAGSEIGSVQTNPDPETFAVLEQIITAVHEAGGVLHFWPWGDSQRGQTPDQLAGGENGAEHLRLLEYIADRLGPLPGWTMGYGFDSDEWTSPENVAERSEFFDAQTDFDHLLGVRSEGPNSGTDHREDVAWHTAQDFADFEHHSPDYDVYLAAVQAADGQPVQSGDRFRIRGEDGPGKDYTQEETVDGLWHSTMAGGVANIWGNLTNPESGEVTKSGNFGSFSYSDETITKISTWDRFFNEKSRFALDAKEANELTGGARNEQYALLSEVDDSIIIYAEDTKNIDLDLSDFSDDRDWADGVSIIAIDTEEAYEEIDLGTYGLETEEITLETVSDWALYITPYDGL